jgi:hypothetical protein
MSYGSKLQLQRQDHRKQQGYWQKNMDAKQLKINLSSSPKLWQAKFWHQTKHANRTDSRIYQEMEHHMKASPELLPLRWLSNIKSSSSSES